MKNFWSTQPLVPVRLWRFFVICVRKHKSCKMCVCNIWTEQWKVPKYVAS